LIHQGLHSLPFWTWLILSDPGTGCSKCPSSLRLLERRFKNAISCFKPGPQEPYSDIFLKQQIQFTNLQILSCENIISFPSIDTNKDDKKLTMIYLMMDFQFLDLDFLFLDSQELWWKLGQWIIVWKLSQVPARMDVTDQIINLGHKTINCNG
jgi:hypothetical protein